MRLDKVRATLSRFEKDGDVPVLAGPWLGEVGFELLYWIPFLRWVVSEFPGLRRRLIIQSRGGVESWYEGLVTRYVDLFAHFTLKEFTERFGQFVKQANTYDGYTHPPGLRDYSSAEQLIIELVRREIGVERLNVLHPNVMYSAFKHIQNSTDRELATYFPKLTPPVVSGLDIELPAQFIAVRFYECFPLPASDANQAFVRKLLAHLGDTLPIVCLNTPMSIDRKHPDFSIEGIENVVTGQSSMTLANNLAVQSAIIGQADAFLGSYGGLSYLSPLFGRPSFSLYSDGRSLSKTNHLAWAQSVLGRSEFGDYWVGSVEEMTPRAVADVVLASR